MRGARNGSRAARIIFIGILGADLLLPGPFEPAIGHDGRPGHREHLRIFDRKLELKPWAGIGGIDHSSAAKTRRAIFLLMMLGGFSRDAAVDEAITFDDMQRVAAGSPETIDHSKRPWLHTNRIDHQ